MLRFTISQSNSKHCCSRVRLSLHISNNNVQHVRVVFLIGFTTEASWPCLRKKQNQCKSVTRRQHSPRECPRSHSSSSSETIEKKTRKPTVAHLARRLSGAASQLRANPRPRAVVDEGARRACLFCSPRQFAHLFSDDRMREDLLVVLRPGHIHRLRVLQQVADLHCFVVIHLVNLLSSFVIFNLLCSCKTFEDRVHQVVPASLQIGWPFESTHEVLALPLWWSSGPSATLSCFFLPAFLCIPLVTVSLRCLPPGLRHGCHVLSLSPHRDIKTSVIPFLASLEVRRFLSALCSFLCTALEVGAEVRSSTMSLPIFWMTQRIKRDLASRQVQAEVKNAKTKKNTRLHTGVMFDAVVVGPLALRVSSRVLLVVGRNRRCAFHGRTILAASRVDPANPRFRSK